MSTTHRVLLVDDHAVVRTGGRQLLESWGGFEVVEAATAADALRLAGEIDPRLVILDLNLPDLGGLEVIPKLLAAQPDLRILVFTMYEDASHASRAMTAGAHGFVSKSDAPDTIVEAASQVAGGGFYLSQPIAQKLALARVGGGEDSLQPLTRRERQVLRLVGLGKTLSEIAGELAVSYKTAANTCTQIKTKLGLSSSAELMRVAIERDLD
jgi:DNA-binding NarL/FixJ family response regulator